MIAQIPTPANTQLVFLSGILLFMTFIPGCTKSNAGGEKPANQNNVMNRLAKEQSPYLLQHADNPVDWYPWGKEAFQTAKEHNKPIFLSIGYSTCHWCHVMEHESFEDDSVAKLLNENFISIKVDREERPEVDHLYMSVCQAMTGSGGWPLTIFMSPDKEPFYAGTYFPKDRRGNRPGMYQLVPALADAWKNKREEVTTSMDRIKKYLQDSNRKTSIGELNENILRDTYTHFMNRYDHVNGGFGRAPKFPSPHNLIYLLRYHHLSGEKTALLMVEKTLKEMRRGGIFDHLGFGFHRYSTDPEWLVPHFEKMLYDQAMLILAYLEAYQLTGDPFYKSVVREISTYILRDMTDPKGGYYSAEDADSEGEEGKFYVWTAEEISALLGDKDGEKFQEMFNVQKSGNFRDEATGTKSKNNILHKTKSDKDIASGLKMLQEDVDSFVEYSRSELFNHRENRIHPLKDDKILTDWNGLMIAAMAKAGAVLNDDNYKNHAKKAADFILENLRKNDGRLYKRYRNGEAGLPGHLDDYAFMIWGLIELYEATFEIRYLKEAVQLSKLMVEDFWDQKNHGFFLGREGDEDLLIRAKTGYDGAIPSGNSVAATCFQRLGRFTGETKLLDIADQTIQIFGTEAERAPRGFTHLLTAFLFDSANPKEIVVVGNSNDDETALALEKIRSSYYPHRVLLFKDTADKNESLTEIANWTASQYSFEGKTTFYVCENFSCKQPTTDINKALGYLHE